MLVFSEAKLQELFIYMIESVGGVGSCGAYRELKEVLGATRDTHLLSEQQTDLS